MHKPHMKLFVESKLNQGETLIGCFMAHRSAPMWATAILGPLASVFVRDYAIAVTDRGVHFHHLSSMGAALFSEFFAFNQFQSLKIGKGVYMTPLTCTFTGGQTLTVQARNKGAALDRSTLSYLSDHARPFVP